jgi:hypothetical protein
MKRIYITALLIVAAFNNLFAQQGIDDGTNPCNNTSPDDVCPLDTWVIGLVAVALIFAVVQLSRKQKRENAF